MRRSVVAQAGGTVRVISNDRLLRRPFLEHPRPGQVERQARRAGAASIAFPPDYRAAGLFYVAYSDRRDALRRGSSISAAPADPLVADPDSAAGRSCGSRSRPGSTTAACSLSGPTATSTSAPATAGRRATRQRRPERAVCCSGRSCGSTPSLARGTALRRSRSRQPVRRRARPRRDLVLRPAEPPAASPSIAPPAPSGSPTSARTATRRSTICRRQGEGRELRLVGLRGASRRSRAASPSHDTVLPTIAYRHRPGCAGHRRLHGPRPAARPDPRPGDRRATTSSATTAPASSTRSGRGSRRRAGKQRSFRLGTRFMNSIGQDNSRRIYILTVRGLNAEGQAHARLGLPARFRHRGPVAG